MMTMMRNVVDIVVFIINVCVGGAMIRYIATHNVKSFIRTSLIYQLLISISNRELPAKL